MKYSSLFALIVGATALTFATSAIAQEEATEPTETPETPAFVDADGDGINDVAAFQHRGGKMIANAYRTQNQQNRAEVDAQLTDDQKSEIAALVESMKAEEASRAEIHTAVTAKLVEYGVTLPNTWNETPGQFAERVQLSTEQRAQIRELVEGMRSEGATRAEVRAAIAAQYENWGIDLPEAPMGGPEADGPRRGLRSVGSAETDAAPEATE